MESPAVVVNVLLQKTTTTKKKNTGSETLMVSSVSDRQVPNCSITTGACLKFERSSGSKGQAGKFR